MEPSLDFRAVAENARDAIVIADEDGHLLYMNGAAEELFGFTRDELAGESLTRLMPERFRAAHVAGLSRYLATGQATVLGRTVELAGQRRDGSEFPLELTLSTWEIDGVRSFSAIIRDTTEQRAAAAARELAEIVASSDDAILDFDLEGTIRSWNPAAERIFGFAAGEAIGRPLAIIVSSDRSADVAEILDRVRRGERIDHQAAIRRRRDGVPVSVSATISPIRNGRGDLRGASMIVRDVTERNLLEQQLVVAGRMASVGTLAAGVAHEINNPLAYVISNLEMAAQEIRELAGPSPSHRMRELTEALDDARLGTERIRRIVRGLKTFSRADAERRSPIQLEPVLELAVNMSFNEIRHRSRLVKDFGRTPLVEADEARLSQVFVNLLVNAAHAIPEGMRERNEIRLVTTTDSAGRAVVEVRDTGCGIPQAVRSKIFDPFFTTKAIGVGTGLGLSICHGIVTAHGGEILIDSVVGQGTTVRVALPAARAATGDAMEVEASPEHAVSARRGRVLVVDDEPQIVTILRRVLAKHHDVVAIGDASVALERLRAGERFDVILCDLMMPTISGMDLHRELSRTVPDQADRVIFMTGGAFSSGAAAFLDTVPNARIEKPFDLKNLLGLVRSFVR